MNTTKYRLQVVEDSEDLITAMSIIHHDDFKNFMTLDSPQLAIYRYLFDKSGVDPKSTKLEAVSYQELNGGVIRAAVISDTDGSNSAIYATAGENIKKFIPEFGYDIYRSGIILGYFKQKSTDRVPNKLGLIHLTTSPDWDSDDLGKSSDFLLSSIYGSRLKKFKEMKLSGNNE